MNLAFDGVCRAAVDAWPPTRFASVTSLVAVSGGADSVALLRALCAIWPAGAQGQIIAAHYNHRLRGADSDADEDFVRALARDLGVPCVVEHAETARDARLESISEEWLRRARYRFFDRVAHGLGARYVALAHTADDNIETFLHNLFRGTGPAGLAGMPRFRPLGADVVIIRPLLNLRRDAIRRALTDIGQPWRTDQSNQDPQWNRNWIRGELLPWIARRYPAADRAILRALVQQDEMMDSLRHSADQFAADRIHATNPQRLEIDRSPPASPSATHPPRTAIVLALRGAWDRQQWPRGEMAERHWKYLLEMLKQGTPRMVNLPGNLRASVAEGDKVVVERITAD